MASQNKRPFSEEDFPALGATTPERAVHARADVPETDEQARRSSRIDDGQGEGADGMTVVPGAAMEPQRVRPLPDAPGPVTLEQNVTRRSDSHTGLQSQQTSKATDDEEGERELQHMYGVPAYGESASSSGPPPLVPRRSRVEAKEFLYATNVEAGGKPNRDAFWAVLPAYGAFLPESTTDSFVLDSRGDKASLFKANCRFEKAHDGATVWKFTQAGFSNQVVLAKPDALRAEHLRQLDFALISAAAARNGAVAVIIIEPHHTKIDDIGRLLSKNTATSAQIQEEVGALAIPVAVIHTSIGKRMDDAMNAVRGVGQLQVFTRLASETRTFENGTRTYAGGSPPLKPFASTDDPRCSFALPILVLGQAPTTWSFTKVWDAGTSAVSSAVSYVGDLVLKKPLLSASLEKLLCSEPWNFGKAESYLQASKEEMISDVSKTCEVLQSLASATTFPVALLLLNKLKGQQSNPDHMRILSTIDVIIRTYICSGSWDQERDRIVDALSEHRLLRRFVDLLRARLEASTQNRFQTDVAGWVCIAELCRIAMIVGGYKSPDFRKLWADLIHKVSAGFFKTQAHHLYLRNQREFGRVIGALPFDLSGSCFGDDELMYAIFECAGLPRNLSDCWEVATIGQRQADGSRFALPSAAVINSPVFQKMLKQTLAVEISPAAISPPSPQAISKSVCDFLTKLARVNELHSEDRCASSLETIMSGLLQSEAPRSFLIMEDLCSEIGATMTTDWVLWPRFVAWLAAYADREFLNLGPSELLLWCASSYL